MKLLTCCLIFTVSLASAQSNLGEYAAKTWESPNGGTFNYRTRIPSKLDQAEQYPVLVFLHGAGGRGDNNIGQLADAGAITAFEKRSLGSELPAFVFAGQVPKGELWVDVKWTTLEHRMPAISNSMRMMFESLDAFLEEHSANIDRNRIYVMGLSMGGYGTWDAMQRRPDFWAAAVPICGGGDVELAKSIAHIPCWTWHGDKDGAINVSRSRDMVAALNAAGGSPKYTEMPGVGHNVWNNCWASDELWEWLFAQVKK
tara:strand:+ start:5959 stop:6729 length:771 start_codon:yes stop_codon:yes gene_type:complete